MNDVYKDIITLLSHGEADMCKLWPVVLVILEDALSTSYFYAYAPSQSWYSEIMCVELNSVGK